MMRKEDRVRWMRKSEDVSRLTIISMYFAVYNIRIDII